jgi:hypothetical protein
LERVILEIAKAWEHKGIAAREERPSIGAVDETCLERMMLVCMDLVSGYLLYEAVARTAAMTPGMRWAQRGSRRKALEYSPW